MSCTLVFSSLDQTTPIFSVFNHNLWVLHFWSFLSSFGLDFSLIDHDLCNSFPVARYRILANTFPESSRRNKLLFESYTEGFCFSFQGMVCFFFITAWFGWYIFSLTAWTRDSFLRTLQASVVFFVLHLCSWSFYVWYFPPALLLQGTYLIKIILNSHHEVLSEPGELLAAQYSSIYYSIFG